MLYCVILLIGHVVLRDLAIRLSCIALSCYSDTLYCVILLFGYFVLRDLAIRLGCVA